MTGYQWFPVLELDLIGGMHTCYIRRPGHNGMHTWVTLLASGRWQVEYGSDLDHTEIISDWPTLTSAKRAASRWMRQKEQSSK